VSRRGLTRLLVSAALPAALAGCVMQIPFGMTTSTAGSSGSSATSATYGAYGPYAGYGSVYGYGSGYGYGYGTYDPYYARYGLTSRYYDWTGMYVRYPYAYGFDSFPYYPYYPVVYSTPRHRGPVVVEPGAGEGSGPTVPPREPRNARLWRTDQRDLAPGFSARRVDSTRPRAGSAPVPVISPAADPVARPATSRPIAIPPSGASSAGRPTASPGLSGARSMPAGSRPLDVGTRGPSSAGAASVRPAPRMDVGAARGPSAIR
jgi:hypothetical protein